MTVLAAVLLVLVMALILSGQWLRSRRRDDKSIQMHRSTLGVIEHVAGADVSSARAYDRANVHVRIVEGPGPRVPEPARDDEIMPAPRAERRSDRPSFPLPKDRTLRPPELPGQDAPSPAPPVRVRRPVLDHEVAKMIAARARAARAARAQAAPVLEPGGSPESAPTLAPAPAEDHRAAIAAGSAAAVLILVLATIGAIGLATKGHRAAHKGGPAHVAAGTHAAPTAVTPRLAPTRVTPPPPAVVATGSNSSFASYTVNATSLNLSLTASGPCWVELRNDAATGPVVYEGTLDPGVTQVFHVVGPIWLRLGDPGGVKLAIDGEPVALPATANPFDVAVTVPSGT